MPLPLEGFRVVDMTEVWAGPMGTTMLADLGAEVIRLESYPRAAMTRPVQLTAASLQLAGAIPPDATRPWDFAPNYHLANRNKLGIALNVRHPLGRPLFQRLLALSDVFVIGYSAGSAERLGAGYEDLAKLNPRLIVVSMPGWGEDGPYQGYATLGSGLDAFSGHFHLRGYPDSDPTTTPPGVFHADATGALALAFAILTALHYRERTGKGQFIDLSQAEVLMSYLARPILDWSMNQRVTPPVGNADPAACPHGAFACVEEGSWVTIAARADPQWRALVAAMGDPAWAQDAALDGVLGRLARRREVEDGVTAWTRTLSQAEVTARLEAAGVPCGPVYDMPAFVQDPQLRARGFFVQHDHPPAPAYERPGPLWRMSETPVTARVATNNLGEHNREVFCGLLGLSEIEFAALMAESVIGDEYRPGSEIDTESS